MRLLRQIMEKKIDDIKTMHETFLENAREYVRSLIEKKQPPSNLRLREMEDLEVLNRNQLTTLENAREKAKLRLEKIEEQIDQINLTLSQIRNEIQKEKKKIKEDTTEAKKQK